MEPKKAYIFRGTVQPYVLRHEPFFMYHFAIPEYDRSKPVLKEESRLKAQSVVDQMNAGLISDEEAKLLLNKIW